MTGICRKLFWDVKMASLGLLVAAPSISLLMKKPIRKLSTVLPLLVIICIARIVKAGLN